MVSERPLIKRAQAIAPLLGRVIEGIEAQINRSYPSVTSGRIDFRNEAIHGALDRSFTTFNNLRQAPFIRVERSIGFLVSPIAVWLSSQKDFVVGANTLYISRFADELTFARNLMAHLILADSDRFSRGVLTDIEWDALIDRLGYFADARYSFVHAQRVTTVQLVDWMRESSVRAELRPQLVIDDAVAIKGWCGRAVSDDGEGLSDLAYWTSEFNAQVIIVLPSVAN